LYFFRWQLLKTPKTLEEFNSFPKVYSNFFEYGLKLLNKPQNPIIFEKKTQIRIKATEPMVYTFKLYSIDRNSLLNKYVFHEISDDRITASFTVYPPNVGAFELIVSI